MSRGVASKPRRPGVVLAVALLLAGVAAAGTVTPPEVGLGCLVSTVPGMSLLGAVWRAASEAEVE